MKYIKGLAIICFSMAVLATFCHWQNNGLVVTELEFHNKRVPTGFLGFRIAQVSDLHNKEFGRENHRLLAAIRDSQPDIIVITGDLVDSRRTNINVAISFVERAAEIAQVYYVSGNHEYNYGQYAQFQEQLLAEGVIILDDSGIRLERGEEHIALLGLADPTFIEYEYDNHSGILVDTLASLFAEYQGMFTVLLSHRPEKMSLYAHNELDLVLAGHAHGGQFRLPLMGGLVAPGQGLFPKYTSGMYWQDGTAVVVNRGLGNSLFPLRLFNRPELVVVTLMGD